MNKSSDIQRPPSSTDGQLPAASPSRAQPKKPQRRWHGPGGAAVLPFRRRGPLRDVGFDDHVEGLQLPELADATPRRSRQGTRRALRAVGGSRWTAPVTDMTMATVGIAAAAVVADTSDLAVGPGWMLALFPALVVVQIAVRGGYRRLIGVPVLDRLRGVLSATALVTMLLITIGAFAHVDDIAQVTARAGIFVSCLLVLGRVWLGYVQRRTRTQGVVATRTLIIGAGEVGDRVARRLRAQPAYGLEPVAFIDPNPVPTARGRSLPVLGGLDDLDSVLEATAAGHVIVAFSSLPDRALVPLARVCIRRRVPVSLVPRLYESVNERFVLEHAGGMPLLSLGAVDPNGWQFAIKHATDRVIALLALFALLPLLLVVAAAIKLSSPGPVLFRQRRVGRDAQEFDVLKFRSMRLPQHEDEFTPRNGHAPGGVEGEDRRTAVGQIIRRMSIDELPQLINVLRGEMSLIGPRPERPEYVAVFRDHFDGYTARHRVKSGITGWAQVHGLRGQTSLADRVEWDNFYIENWSLWLDVKIMIMTVAAVFRGT